MGANEIKKEFKENVTDNKDIVNQKPRTNIDNRIDGCIVADRMSHLLEKTENSGNTYELKREENGKVHKLSFEERKDREFKFVSQTIGDKSFIHNEIIVRKLGFVNFNGEDLTPKQVGEGEIFKKLKSIVNDFKSFKEKKESKERDKKIKSNKEKERKKIEKIEKSMNLFIKEG